MVYGASPNNTITPGRDMPNKIEKRGNGQKQDIHKILHDLDALAKTKGVSYAECARQMGVTGRHFQRIRKGDNMTLENLNAYANVFGVEVRCQLAIKAKGT